MDKNKHLEKTSNLDSVTDKTLLEELRVLIEETKNKIVYTANAELVILNWKLGYRIQKETLKDTRAEYGEKIVVALSQQLFEEYGRGFSKSALLRMIQFYKAFPDFEIVATLSRQLSWSHFIELISLNPALKRDFYAEMCRIERWSVRKLRDKINGMLYERTAISKQPEKVIQSEIEKLRKEDILTPNLILKDPYILDFLELSETHNEKDLESAILREIEKFILELGSDFSFIARQKRIMIGDDDFYLDLLFFNRALRRLIAIELKMEKFKAADKGQMELYLRWLDKHEKKPEEEKPLGIILCTDKNREQVELLELDQNGIHVAEFLTKLPPIELFERKLHNAIKYAKARLENKAIAEED